MYPRNTLDVSQVLKRILSIPTFITFVIVSGIIVILVTGFDIDMAKVMSIIFEAGPVPYILAFLTHYLSFVFRGLRWKYLVGTVNHHKQPSSFEYVKLIFLSNFINSASLFRIGDLYKVYAFNRKYAKGFTNLLGTLITERLLDCVMLAILVGVFGQVLLQTANKEIQMIVVFPIILLGILLLAFIAVIKIKKIPKFPLLTNLIHKAKEGAQIPKKNIVPAFLMSILAWVCEIVRVYFIASALQFDLEFAHTSILSLVHAMLTLVPTPGGIGAVESGVAGLGTLLLNMTPENSIALILLDRSITYLSVLLIGGFVFIWEIIDINKKSNE
ncbi:MAG: lysylphosphatidylglycerol synthase transmembrane domain-containing protein [Dehalococcoidia bacterium]